ncbi:tail fiber protein [Escherichia coli]|nr:tail fiber protein [Salmonella enterica]MBB2263147.1 tail fiber protein [Escherichia coli]
MNDVTVVTSVTYPSPESLALVADVQYHEPYLSAALNRKFRGIVDPGFYAGFLPKPGGGMNLLITSVDGDKTAGAASVDIGEFYQVTIQHRKDISLALSAGKKYAIVLKGRYLLGEDTYQVNTASHIHAAEFVARTYTDSYQLGDGELLVCTVNIPAGVSAITQEMIDTSERINRTIGIDISDSVTSSRSDVAASSLAVKKAYDLAKSKYTAQDASTTQKGLVQLSSATNSDSETMAATPKAVKSIKDLADTKAPIESPSLTGTPTAPTAAQGTNSTQIANTAFVKAAITALINGAPGTLDTLKEIAAAINNDPNYSTTINNALALKAPLASPALTGVPTAPTAAQGTNNTQIATTAYVRAAISALVGSSPEALDTLNELAAALGNDPNFATTMTNALAGKQPLDATLTALAGLATGANKLPYFTGTDTVSQTDLTSVGRDILAKTSVLAVIQYLGSSTYFMLTASGDNLGTWNSLRPLTINNANGAVSIGNGLNVTGDIRTNAWVYANRFSVNSSSGSWISMRDQNVIFGLNKVSTSSAQALLRQDHADRKFFIGGLGNSQFGFYMINNSRTSNGTDGQAFLDSSGNFQCGGQILPANYSNFDSRYTLKTACVTSVRMGSAASYKPSSNGVSWTQNLGSGLVMTGIIVQETGSNSADNIGGIYYRPVQYCINGTWYTAASV